MFGKGREGSEVKSLQPPLPLSSQGRLSVANTHEENGSLAFSHK